MEYALHDARKPIGVATYEITKTLPKALRGQLPSPKDIAHLLWRTYETDRHQRKGPGIDHRRLPCGGCRLLFVFPGHAEAIEDDGIAFEEKMAELSDRLYEQMRESVELDAVIRRNFSD